MSGMKERGGPAGRRIAFALALAALGAFAVRGALAETPRRICASIESHYYVFDSRFFGLESAFGAGAALRYELASDFYFENEIGVFGADEDGADVDGLDYRLNLFVIVPLLIPVPYRPVARLGVGFLSVNPVTATPTDTYRPTQTTFYILGGAGVTRPLFGNMLLEGSASVWVTPYTYRIYRFNRLDVDTSNERFTHLAISLALTYTF
ncbi:MAG: hypothetical protein NTW97_03935 [Candidatus Krumholzibacteria bacterium]|nr:hypothetical protein [Candidatus Krumholzibacteria bacterium]